MNEKEFKNLEDIGNYKIRFKCYNGPDGYQATFHIYHKSNLEIHYKIDFEISDTQYCSEIKNSGKSTAGYIIEKYGDIENCFKEIGVEYLKEKISQCNLKNENIFLTKYLF